MRQNIREWIKAVGAAVAMAVIIIQFVIPTTVYGVSMEPNFEPNDYLLVNRLAYDDHRKPERGDVVVFSSHLKDKNGEDKMLIKRVVGLPGETVEVRDGMVYINGEVLEEDYTKDGITNGEVAPVIIPENDYFCLGDNRLHSTDSRFMEVGLVDAEDLVGQVIFRLYPFNKIGVIGD